MIGQGMHGFVENRELVIPDIDKALREPTDKRIFVISKAFRAGYTVDQVHALTKIDRWFLEKLMNIMDTSRALHEYQEKVQVEPEAAQGEGTSKAAQGERMLHSLLNDKAARELLHRAKIQGFSDFQIARAFGLERYMDGEDAILAIRALRKRAGILPVVNNRHPCRRISRPYQLSVPDVQRHRSRCALPWATVNPSSYSVRVHTASVPRWSSTGAACRR